MNLPSATRYGICSAEICWFSWSWQPAPMNTGSLRTPRFTDAHHEGVD